METYKKIGLTLTLGLGIACATSPTGRSQFIIVSDGKLAAMSDTAFGEMKQKVAVEKDPKTIAYVNCVAQEIIRASRGRAGDSWDVVVFKSDQINAFAMPGGKIGVYTGILKVAKTQDQLAAILGHEVGHVMARHSAERVSAALATQAGMAAADALLQKKDNPTRNTIMAALGLGTQFGVLLPHSRGNESEADIIGQQLMAEAGFNPQENVELWRNMSAASKGSTPEFLSTHPSSSSRIQHLQNNMGEAIKIMNQARARGLNPRCS